MCHGEIPPEVLPAIAEIPVASFGALFSVNAVSRDNHRVHLEEVFPSGWQTIPCKREISKEEVLSLSCQGLTFLPPDAAAPIFHLEGSVSAFSKELFPLLDNREPPYEEALYWPQFAFTGNTKGQYVAPAYT